MVPSSDFDPSPPPILNEHSLIVSLLLLLLLSTAKIGHRPVCRAEAYSYNYSVHLQEYSMENASFQSQCECQFQNNISITLQFKNSNYTSLHQSTCISSKLVVSVFESDISLELSFIKHFKSSVLLTSCGMLSMVTLTRMFPH